MFSAVFSYSQLPVKRTEVGAGTVVSTFFIHTEGVPRRRTVDFFLRHIVHADRNTEHGSQSDEIGTDVAVVEGTVICTPVGHDAVNIGKRTF